MSSQPPARLRRAKGSSESFAGLIAGSFIIATLAEEWRVAVLHSGQSDKREADHFGGEDAFSFGRDDHNSVQAADAIGSLSLDSASLPAWDGVTEATLAPEFDLLSPDATSVAMSSREDAASVAAHHHTGWLITPA